MLAESDIAIDRVFHVRKSPKWRKKEGAIDAHKLIYCYEGNTVYVFANNQYSCIPGTILYIPPNLAHAGFRAHNCRPSFFSIRFQARAADTCDGTPESPLTANAIRRAYVHELFSRIVELCMHAQAQRTMHYASMLLGSALFELVLELERAQSFSHIQYRRIKAAHESMVQSPATPFDLETLAKKAGYSPQHFTRVYRLVQGTNPRHAHTLIRLQYGRMLIEEKGASVKEAACATGYAEQHIFSKLFRRYFGVPPSKI